MDTDRTPHARGWQPRFLRELRDRANVRAACEAAQISRSRAYECRGADDAFRALWDEAVEDACDLLEAEAWRRALEGVEEPVYQGGQLVGHVTRYSETMLTNQLRALRPEKYRERVDARHSGPGGGAIPLRHTLDLSRLSAEELDALERMVARAAGDPGGESPP